MGRKGGWIRVEGGWCGGGGVLQFVLFMEWVVVGVGVWYWGVGVSYCASST